MKRPSAADLLWAAEWVAAHEDPKDDPGRAQRVCDWLDHQAALQREADLVVRISEQVPEAPRGLVRKTARKILRKMS